MWGEEGGALWEGKGTNWLVARPTHCRAVVVIVAVVVKHHFQKVYGLC